MDYNMKTQKFDIKIIGYINEYILASVINICEDKNSVSIYIHSAGGDADAAWSIKNFLESNKINTTIFCARAESASLILLSAANKKFAYKHTSFMLHDGKLSNDTRQNRKIHAKKIDRFNKMYRELYPKIVVSGENQYFSSYEMLEMGYIDQIL